MEKEKDIILQKKINEQPRPIIPTLRVGGTLTIDSVSFRVIKALKRNRYVIGLKH